MKMSNEEKEFIEILQLAYRQNLEKLGVNHQVTKRTKHMLDRLTNRNQPIRKRKRLKVPTDAEMDRETKRLKRLAKRKRSQRLRVPMMPTTTKRNERKEALQRAERHQKLLKELRSKGKLTPKLEMLMENSIQGDLARFRGEEFRGKTERRYTTVNFEIR